MKNKFNYSPDDLYECRHCGKLIQLENDIWVHVESSFYDFYHDTKTMIVGSICEVGNWLGNTKAEPIPLNVIRTNEEEKI